jgi:hypothetical protein
MRAIRDRYEMTSAGRKLCLLLGRSARKHELDLKRGKWAGVRCGQLRPCHVAIRSLPPSQGES